MRRIVSGFSGGQASTEATSQPSAAADVNYYQRLSELQLGMEIFPLTAPGLPMLAPGSSFLSQAIFLGDESRIVEGSTKNEDGKKVKTQHLEAGSGLYDLVRSALRKRDFTMPVELDAHRTKEAQFVPGHLWSETNPSGPRKADVMIITKMPWITELERKRCFVDADGDILASMLEKLRAPKLASWYVTHLVKFMPPNFKTQLKAGWVKDGMHLLMHEILIVQPKYILCLGSDASKALLGPQATITAMEGRVETFTYSPAFDAAEVENRKLTAHVMAVVHPKQVLRDQVLERQMEQGLGRFVSLVRGREVGKLESVQHTVIDNFEQLWDALIAIETDDAKHDNVVAVDAEWHGDHPVNAGSYVRTVQIAWLAKKAIGIKLHEQGGQPTPGFRDLGQFAALMCTFFKGGEHAVTLSDGTTHTHRFKRKRVVGHFFTSDLEWLLPLGINIIDCFSCPLHPLDMSPDKKRGARELQLYHRYLQDGFGDKGFGDVPAWYRTKYEGGADTGLMCHAIEESAQYKLEVLAMRYTSAPRYDDKLLEWRDAYCKANGLTSKNMEGYGECPDDVLLPYGMYDADVTLRLFYAFDVLLDDDYDHNCCREAFWESQIAAPAAFEINTAGITLDRSRVDYLTTVFNTARNKMEAELRSEIQWPLFNIRSVQHVKELLFGHELNGKKDKVTGAPVVIRPSGAKSLRLTPVFDTSKPPKQWAELIRNNKTAEASPSTNKQALSLLAQDAPPDKAKTVNQVRDYRFVDQVLKSILRPPMVDEETEEPSYDEDGNLEYDAGLASVCCDDGKVRTHIYQVKETGRWSSARPPLQNISKQRDPDYKRLLGADYKYSLRTVMRSSPGTVLLEADFVGAELFGMAVMSGDENMIRHATRNQLPESDPEYYDIHSNVAKDAFKLTCPPTKSGLKSIGKVHLRIIAKSVIFGIAYGRGAKAIAIAAKEQGFEVSVDEAQKIIDTIFAMYPRLQPFFLECQQRATGVYEDPVTGAKVPGRYVCSCFGRFRRFPESRGDRSLSGEFERQAMNFPIQSMIASVVSRAIAYLQAYRDAQAAKGEHMFKILLQIHDAILFEVPYRYVRHVCEKVLPRYMRQSVPIYPSRLDGIPTGAGPYYLGLEAEVMEHWGETVSYGRALELGLPTGTGGAEGCVVHFSKDAPAGAERPAMQPKEVSGVLSRDLGKVPSHSAFGVSKNKNWKSR